MHPLNKLKDITVKDIPACRNTKCPFNCGCDAPDTLHKNNLMEKYPSLLQSALLIMEQKHLGPTFTIQSLADELRITPRHIRRLFQQYLECNPEKCLLLLRFRKAVTLANQQQNLSVKEIWVKAGFNSWGSFEHTRKKNIKQIQKSKNLKTK